MDLTLLSFSIKVFEFEFILTIFFFFTSAPSCLSSSLLPSSFVVYLLAPEEDSYFCSKTLVFCCFLAFRHTGGYIFLDLFNFVDLTGSCSLIPSGTKVNG